MRKMLFLLLASSGVLLADVRVPKPWNPGWFGPFAESPGVRLSGLRLGILWTEPMEGVDCDAIGFFAEWGNFAYRLAASYVHTSLDSIYRSEDFGLEASLSPGRLNLGISGNAEIQIVPGEDSDFRYVLRPGISWEWRSGRLGAWASVPSDFEENSYFAECFFSPGKNFTGGFQVHYRREAGALFSFGEEVRLGILAFQGIVSYPGPKIGVGIRMDLGRAGASAGAYRDGNYMDSRMFGLYGSIFK